MIQKEILIEELIERIPQSVTFLREKGLVCILCGEPVWGTLEELAKSKGFSAEQIADIVSQLNTM
ncbi:MAG TPA: hypothetical protein PL017_03135 [Tenuifilaceae bacterium]|nr:hypothetical protein [Tenuifilaceae bacterium]HPE18338.1 hypothetical protein [Tenuifilaceae bacterium]HPJ45065.1 hypothetical protein [Tenuifilaceae bacterium]HPQ34752.1 hypothetical protein [Tenuifilaceae bacterium]HRX67519.1 hypothetical protein [Tenuifilaceae bacterium]